MRSPIPLALLCLALGGCESLDISDDARQVCQDVRDCGGYRGASFSTYEGCVDELLAAVEAGRLDRDGLESAEVLERCADCWLATWCNQCDCDPLCGGIVRCDPEGGTGDFVWDL